MTARLISEVMSARAFSRKLALLILRCLLRLIRCFERMSRQGVFWMSQSVSWRLSLLLLVKARG